MSSRWLCISGVLILLAGCAGGGGSRPDSAQGGAVGSGKSGAAKSSGRYAMERDAYPKQPPDVSDVPDAVPRVEPLARSGNRPTYEVWGKAYQVMPDSKGYEDEGRASWYGEKFQGYATASGEVYDMYKMTAAHRSLPLPTYARVTNVDNNRSVIVKVNDRGPFHDDRLIDLSYAAAARLDILRSGTGHVRVEAIDPVAWQASQQGPQAQDDIARAKPIASSAKAASDAKATLYGASETTPQAVDGQPVGAPQKATAAEADERLYVQVAALGSASNARALRERLQGELDSPVRIASDSRMHRVQVGPVDDRVALEALRSELRRAGYAQVLTITASD